LEALDILGKLPNDLLARTRQHRATDIATHGLRPYVVRLPAIRRDFKRYFEGALSLKRGEVVRDGNGPAAERNL
jgi:hypothetical protein